MIFLFRFLFIRSPITIVSRLPSFKMLSTNTTGLSLALLLAAFHIPGITGFSAAGTIVLFCWFVAGTFAGGSFVIITAVFWLLYTISGSLLPAYALLSSFMELSTLYLAGYLSGAAVAILYNDLVYLFIHIFEHKKIRIIFGMNAEQSVNIVKSPVEAEEEVVNEYIEKASLRFPRIKWRKLYDDKLSDPPAQPYTIAFVANPLIEKRKLKRDDEPRFELDPILDDYSLFVNSVHQALVSFEQDSVLGHPEIFSRLRFVAIFPKISKDMLQHIHDDKISLIEEFQENLFSIEDQSEVSPVDHNLLSPRKSMVEELDKLLKTGTDSPIGIDEIDVIFGVTASPTHYRGFAHASDWQVAESGENLIYNIPNREGIKYSFDIDPHQRKGQNGTPSIKMPIISDMVAPFFSRTHDYYPIVPGRVAVNALTASQYTYVHEFAHAMSSAYHGMIADEYSDGFTHEEETEDDSHFPWFYINRIERDYDNLPPNKLIPVHKEFATYNCNLFFSDIEHPSAEAKWRGYFPERAELSSTCLMDRSYGNSHFDSLLSTFIYDRLSVKSCRPPRPAINFSNLWNGADNSTSIIADISIEFPDTLPALPEPVLQQKIEEMKKLVQETILVTAQENFKNKSLLVEVHDFSVNPIKAQTSLLTTEGSVDSVFTDCSSFESYFTAFLRSLKVVSETLKNNSDALFSDQGRPEPKVIVIGEKTDSIKKSS